MLDTISTFDEYSGLSLKPSQADEGPKLALLKILGSWKIEVPSDGY